MQGIAFHLTVRGPDALFGTVAVWRGQQRVAVSDPTRTIVDVLDDPRLGGGIRTVSDVLREYMVSEHRDDRPLIAYGDRLGTGARCSSDSATSSSNSVSRPTTWWPPVGNAAAPV